MAQRHMCHAGSSIGAPRRACERSCGEHAATAGPQRVTWTLLRARAAKLRRRIVCIMLARQLLTGCGAPWRGSSGRWPTDQGLKLTPPGTVLQALQPRFEPTYGAGCDEAPNPREVVLESGPWEHAR